MTSGTPHPDTDADPFVIHLHADTETELQFGGDHAMFRYDYVYFVPEAINRCYDAPHFPGTNAWLDVDLKVKLTLPAGRYKLCAHQGTTITFHPHILAISS